MTNETVDTNTPPALDEQDVVGSRGPVEGGRLAADSFSLETVTAEAVVQRVGQVRLVFDDQYSVHVLSM